MDEVTLENSLVALKFLFPICPDLEIAMKIAHDNFHENMTLSAILSISWFTKLALGNVPEFLGDWFLKDYMRDFMYLQLRKKMIT